MLHVAQESANVWLIPLCASGQASDGAGGTPSEPYLRDAAHVHAAEAHVHDGACNSSRAAVPNATEAAIRSPFRFHTGLEACECTYVVLDSQSCQLKRLSVAC